MNANRAHRRARILSKLWGECYVTWNVLTQNYSTSTPFMRLPVHWFALATYRQGRKA